MNMEEEEDDGVDSEKRNTKERSCPQEQGSSHFCGKWENPTKPSREAFIFSRNNVKSRWRQEAKKCLKIERKT